MQVHGMLTFALCFFSVLNCFLRLGMLYEEDFVVGILAMWEGAPHALDWENTRLHFIFAYYSKGRQMVCAQGVSFISCRWNHCAYTDCELPRAPGRHHAPACPCMVSCLCLVCHVADMSLRCGVQYRIEVPRVTMSERDFIPFARQARERQTYALLFRSHITFNY